MFTTALVALYYALPSFIGVVLALWIIRNDYRGDDV